MARSEDQAGRADVVMGVLLYSNLGEMEMMGEDYNAVCSAVLSGSWHMINVYTL